MMNWLEVSLTVDGELAEAVADVLARFAPNGVMTEQGIKFRMMKTTARRLARSSSARIWKWMNNRRNATKTRRIALLFGDDPAVAGSRLQTDRGSKLDGSLEAALQADSHRTATHHRAGLAGFPEPERIPIKIDPGMAFGTGTHPTTQLCLAVDRSIGLTIDKSKIVNPQSSSVIDVGCGSGILSIAALKLGAQDCPRRGH